MDATPAFLLCIFEWSCPIPEQVGGTWPTTDIYDPARKKALEFSLVPPISVKKWHHPLTF